MDDQAFPDADSIYPAVNQWYGDGRPNREAIENLDDLKQLPNLRQVYVVAQDLPDISALSGMELLSAILPITHDCIQGGPTMQKMISILLAAALALCGLMALAEQGDSRDDMSRFSIPHIPTPSIPPVEVPEIDEIEVPKVPTAAPTGTPKIEVPEIPEVDVPGLDAPQVTSDAGEAVEVALAAMGVDAYRALYDALSRGETICEGSTGDAAKGLQQLLAAFGQDVRADGIVGPKTVAALNAVQDQYGLPRADSLDAAGLAALLPLLLANEQPAR